MKEEGDSEGHMLILYKEWMQGRGELIPPKLDNVKNIISHGSIGTSSQTEGDYQQKEFKAQCHNCRKKG